MMYAHSMSPRELAVPGIASLHSFSSDRGGRGRGRAASHLPKAAPPRIGRQPEGSEPAHLMELFAAAFVVVAVTFGPVLAWLLLHIAGEAG